MPGQIHEVYAELGRVLEFPETFGLGRNFPPALAETLRSSRRMLEQAMREQPVSLDGCGCRTSARPAEQVAREQAAPALGFRPRSMAG